jgi:hypothetical protein
MNFEEVGNVIDALQKVAYLSVHLYECNDALISELTRVVNIYSDNIAREGNDRQKRIYKKTFSLMNKGEQLSSKIETFEKAIQSFLKYVAENTC